MYPLSPNLKAVMSVPTDDEGDSNFINYFRRSDHTDNSTTLFQNKH